MIQNKLLKQRMRIIKEYMAENNITIQNISPYKPKILITYLKAISLQNLYHALSEKHKHILIKKLKNAEHNNNNNDKINKLKEYLNNTIVTLYGIENKTQLTQLIKQIENLGIITSYYYFPLTFKQELTTEEIQQYCLIINKEDKVYIKQLNTCDIRNKTLIKANDFITQYTTMYYETVNSWCFNRK